jgi:tRNA threonylcarbamoyladenosine biosynthesis protein TsaE
MRCWRSYEAPGLAISHFDFYRFSDPREWEDAGFREIFAARPEAGRMAREGRRLLPLADLRLHIEPGARTRT